MKSEITLTNPVDLGNGLIQSKATLNYLYINDDNTFTVYTKQGPAENMGMNAVRQAFIDDIEAELKTKLEAKGLAQ